MKDKLLYSTIISLLLLVILLTYSNYQLFSRYKEEAILRFRCIEIGDDMKFTLHGHYTEIGIDNKKESTYVEVDLKNKVFTYNK